ncbi:hypothetical protein CERZMDRAFT_94351 [Cercospora zeae-maydis SCOH1-5]|uniref:Fork-head domain-containing protein n=1 Tax=Cercospora zeae-maydis SCOH1-5 TaxID=717836 RepID=A0A6A6FR51_9PEZI|nr:hypothetical protein CERZMDRAFT_94351 [Cercospora zeae-maydis SCOH1-5]
MESSGAAASPWPNGLAMNGSSNRVEMQQTGRPDPANLIPPPQHDVVHQKADVGVGASGEQNTTEDNGVPVSYGSKDPDTERQASSNAQASIVEHEACSIVQGNMTAPAPLDVHPSDFANLDTPARPVVDHGIESNVRDTIDLQGAENGLLSAGSAQNNQPHSLGLYTALPDVDQLLFGHDPATNLTLADPSTPSNAHGNVGFTASPTMVEEEPSTHEAYAMLKFPDSYYYVKSMNVMVGRDQHFYDAWRESQKQTKKKTKMQRRAQQSLDDYAREPSHHSQHGGDDEEDLVGRPAHGLLSTYSDVGGAVSYVDPTDYGFESTTVLTQRNRRSKNNSSSNHSIAPRSLHEFEQGDELEGELYADSHGKVHEPQEWAQVTIHPREPNHIVRISREHLIIRYDRENTRWVMDVIGNMILHNGGLRRRGDSDIVLNHDDEIIIVSVSFRFMLPTDHEGEEDFMESVEYDENGAENELDTSPADLRLTHTRDTVDTSDEGDSSEEDVPLAQQSKPKKSKDKKSKTKEPKPKPVKLKLKIKNAGKKAQASIEAASLEDKAPKAKGKTPAKSSGKAPVAVAKTPAKEDGASESANQNVEAEAAKPKDEASVAPSIETPLPVEASQASQSAQPTQASPPAAINLDANSAFAGADPSQLPQKRKGPGRPPKNGLISKRDDAGVKRKLKEYERQGIAPPPMNDLLEMVRAEQRQKDAAAKAASRGEAAPEAGMQNVDPRMQNYSTAYAATTPNQPQQNVASGSSAPNDLQTPRSTSPRPRRPARSPSPMPPRESFTEEQLKKPSITYVFIIDEILQDPALDGQADLQTIYDKIQKRWPYYRYGTATTGWQSSVRHNLLQSPRFVESGKSGKGKYWKIDFSHELDPKKRKQATPPPPNIPRNGGPYQQPLNAAYQQGGQMYHSPYIPGSNPVAGPSCTGNMNGQVANGPYPQTHYGPQNGTGPASQHPQPAQPQQPEPFANIVGAILAYQPRFLAAHVGKETHERASKQFQDALLYYSDLHAGTTPATEGEVDETQDPYKTLKQIFIHYGQGDTRTSQSGKTNGDSTAPATNAAPDSNPNSGAPVATVQNVDGVSASTTTAAAVNTQPAPPATLANNGMPVVQGGSIVGPQQSQSQPGASAHIATQQPQQAVSQSAPEPAATVSMSGQTRYPNPTPPLHTLPPGGPRPLYQPTSADAPSSSHLSIARPQQPNVIAPRDQSTPATSQLQVKQPTETVQSSQQAQPVAQTALTTTPSHLNAREQKASQPEASQSTPHPLNQSEMPPVPEQQSTQVAQVTPNGGEVSTTNAPNSVPVASTPIAEASDSVAAAAKGPPPPAITNGSAEVGRGAVAVERPVHPSESHALPVERTDLPHSTAGVKRPAEENEGDHEAKRRKSTNEPEPDAAIDVRPTSAGVKRPAEEGDDEHAAKRMKATNEPEPDPVPAAP